MVYRVASNWSLGCQSPYWLTLFLSAVEYYYAGNFFSKARSKWNYLINFKLEWVGLSHLFLGNSFGFILLEWIKVNQYTHMCSKL